jgi:hypothetical protein
VYTRVLLESGQKQAFLLRQFPHMPTSAAFDSVKGH